MCFRTLCIAFLACISLAAFGDPPNQSSTVTIPLKDIWASNMPGTIDVRDLEPEAYGSDAKKLPLEQYQQAYKSSKITQIIISLEKQPYDQVASDGFAVEGTGKTALNAACDVIVEHKKPQKILVGQDVSIVFFSREFNYYIHITEVTQQQNTFHIQYQFVPHDTKDTTVHFALIPVGKLSGGVYSVEIEPTQHLEQKLRDWEKRIVCKSFSFTVANDTKKKE
ncbi:MAG TPA: hypothetical protein VFE46_08940 [Pirellulales bacterium]|nr:hypothetical protein [Pirellulales bacterium]